MRKIVAERCGSTARERRPVLLVRKLAASTAVPLHHMT